MGLILAAVKYLLSFQIVARACKKAYLESVFMVTLFHFPKCKALVRAVSSAS
jgi:hypothetical protein